ncbi:MAG: glycosyl transferase, group 1 [uncultured bacterium (gcode 4)]|uniref:Glycosyl transferase, group 1 n=1 Tax=uncultured bacterium (gcode 4) TaxID=1234023 RepID=K2AWR3_9BACT|nr:MAG: glycosyl transferase, group 1 [uncultured bacterium (gcode 4)]
MKIWIDCRMYSTHFTGIWRYVYELVSYLESHDTKNEYVLFFNEPHFSNYNVPSVRFKKVLINAKHYSYKEQTIFLYKLYKEKLDLMHFTHFNAPLFYFRPSIVTIHDLTLSFYPGKKMTKHHHRLAYNLTIKNITKRAVKIIAVSAHTKKDIIEILNVPEEKIEVVYEWINKSDFFEASADEIEKLKLNFNLKKDYIFYVGVLREHKNLLRLIKAYSELLKEWEDIDLVIAWKEDVYLEVRNTIINEKLQKNVHLLGFVSEYDLNVLYSGARAMIYPSLYEGFWLPVLEAMAHSVPVACSNISSLPEIAGENWAVLFNPLSIESIKSGIKEVINNKTLRKRLIENWLKRINDFSWEKMWEQILNLYNKIEK